MIKFRELELSDAIKVLNWRTSKRVTNFMDTDIEYNLKKQNIWLRSSFSRYNYYHWIIQFESIDIGLINFVNWDIRAKTTSWGFYIGEEKGLGIGGFVPPYFYNFCFDILNVDVVCAEIFYKNTNLIQLHLKQGYQFDPSNNFVIQKNGEDILMISMKLLKEKFKTSKFSSFKQNFPIKKWTANPIKTILT